MYWARYVLLDQALRGGGMHSTECPSSFILFYFFEVRRGERMKFMKLKGQYLREKKRNNALGIRADTVHAD